MTLLKIRRNQMQQLPVPSKIPIRKLSKALFLHYKAEKSIFSLPLRYEFLHIKNKNASSLQSWKILH